MITIKLPIQNKIDIFDIQRVYSSCVRFSFNRISEGLDQKEIRPLVKDKFKIGSWLQQCAIMEAKQIYSSAQERKDGKAVIFGGRKNWRDYINGEISKDQFKNKRILPICSQGECPTGGNRFFKLHIKEQNSIEFRPDKNTRIKIELPKLKKEYKNWLFKLEEKATLKEIPFQVKLSSEFIWISFDESKFADKKIELKKNRVLGLDLNPNYIGLSILEFNQDNSFKVIHKEVFNMSELTKEKNSKILFESLEISKHICSIAKNWKCSKVAIEDLNIKSGDLGRSRKNNKLCNNSWPRSKFSNNLKKRCNLAGIELVEVNPAYSSIVGNIQYGNDSTPDMVAASIEIARRSYRKFEKGWFYPVEKNVENLRNLWKEEVDLSFSNWKTIASQIKELDLRYRFSLAKDLEFFRLRSYKSRIQKYIFI